MTRQSDGPAQLLIGQVTLRSFIGGGVVVLMVAYLRRFLSALLISTGRPGTVRTECVGRVPDTSLP